jgi:hypothetical protein
MTGQEIASTILNNVKDGLSGIVTSSAISYGQIESEIDLVRAKLFFDQERSGKLEVRNFIQEIPNLHLTCRDLTADCNISSGEGMPSVKIPKVLVTQTNNALAFVGFANKSRSFTVYYDVDDIINHKYRLKTAKAPFCWVDMSPDKDDLFTLFFFNLGQFDSLKYVTIRGAFESPYKVSPLDPLFDQKEYPAPAYIQEMIITTLTERYLRYYRSLNILSTPNTQTDPNT